MDYKKDYFTPLSKRQKFALKVFKPIMQLLKANAFNVDIVQSYTHSLDSVTIEQRLNIFHLINEVMSNKTDGDFAEFGTNTGQTALQIQGCLKSYGTEKNFHVYDIFEHPVYGEGANIKNKFIKTFINAEIELPVIHEGMFNDTIPTQLPDKLAFVHIDCGYGGDIEEHKETVLMLLNYIYPRMLPNAICLLMDYHDVNKVVGGTNSNPGVKMACDIFLADKPENVYQLYGNQFSHGYFKKT